MLSPRTFIGTLTGLLFTLLCVPAAADDPPVLLRLAHLEAGERVETEVAAAPGLTVSPHAGKPRSRWAVIAGDVIKSAQRPPDREVELYRAQDGNRILLCAIRVRYFRDRSGDWTPRYLLIEEPLLMRDGDRWKPLLMNKGVPNLLVRTGGDLPNAQGYFSTIEFGLTASLTTIDAWKVR